jgi:hypothetical protein
MTDTPETNLVEDIYGLLEDVNLFLDIINSKRILVIGSFDEDVLLFDKKK